MSNFYDKYLAESAEYAEKIKALTEERHKIDAKIERLNKKLVKVEKAIEDTPYVGTYRLIECLAEELSENLGLEYRIYGPFGINCETSIYFVRNKCDDICGSPTVGLNLRPSKKNNEDWLVYWNGEVTNNYQPGSIGYLNNCHHVYVPLPDKTEDILKLLAPKIQRFNAKCFLREQAKEKQAAHYSIVEDSYEYENGLCLIIYKDKNEEVELEHICVNIDEFDGNCVLKKIKSKEE